MKRRDFIKSTLAVGVGISAAGSSALNARNAAPMPAPDHPVAVASGNGEEAVAKAMAMIKSGSDPLDAVVEGVAIVENDPEDIFVGYGGLPNERGVVQLDASVMHGPTHNAGAVAAIEGIKNPAKVAKLVMERTDHVLLVGSGAQEFALAHGFKKEDLLTDKSRRIWLEWKESLNPDDNWFEGPETEHSHLIKEYIRHYGTINCLGIDTNGDLAGVTTTSGLSFKIPGRVGDSPIIGAGLFVDNEVGAGGSTGRGEANLKNLCSFMIVEFMRQGKSPEEACLAVCERIANHTKLPHLKAKSGKPNFGIHFYAINKKGEFGAGGMYHHPDAKYAVADADGVRLLEIPYLYKDRD